MKLEDFIKDCNPGIINAVRFFWNLGYHTTDSGDGTNFNNGMEGALPYDHVVITVSPTDLIASAFQIQRLLNTKGCDKVLVEATFYPKEDLAIILISDIFDSKQLRTL